MKKKVRRKQGNSLPKKIPHTIGVGYLSKYNTLVFVLFSILVEIYFSFIHRNDHHGRK